MKKKLVKGFYIIGIVAGLYAMNFLFCAANATGKHQAKRASPIYSEYNQTVEIIKHYNKVLDTGLLTEEGKKYFTEKIQELTNQEQKLEDKLNVYNKSAREWLERGKNPLNYFK